MAQIPNSEEKEELKEFLKRAEIRTMQKDIARLREIEAQKERERIAAIKAKEEKIQVLLPVKEKIPEPEKERPITLIPKPSKKTPPFIKILIRAGVVIILFLVLGFFYWFFWAKKAEIPSEEVIPPTEEVVEEPEIVVPLSLISIATTETLGISTLEEIPLFLSQLLGKSFETDGFVRILIKDTKESKILGLKEFFEAFEIKTPEGFLEKLNNDFTLFIYSSKGVDRLGFVAEIQEKEGISDFLKSWEPTMEKDTENLLMVLGKEGSASVPYFKEATYKDVTFRYLSFPPENFGICWSILRDYFLFTSSGESMIKFIDEIRTPF